MNIREDSIVVREGLDGWESTHYRVERVDGHTVYVRNLESYRLTKENADDFQVVYQTGTFDQGDIVRVRREYVNRYNEADGENELTVVAQYTDNPPTTRVKNNNGDMFKILSERLYLVRPSKSFKAGDRVVVDPDLAKKYDFDDVVYHWRYPGVMVLTEDSGSRAVQTTSHVRFEDDETTNNVPTRWLKPYVEPAKRVVRETIKAADVQVGDKLRASFTLSGCAYELTGVVQKIYGLYAGPTLSLGDGAVHLSESSGVVFTLLEEAPEPVDENLQRLLDAEVGDITFGTYADEYWRKISKDHWQEIGGKERLGDTEGVFDSLFKIKYGKLNIYRKVEDAD